MRAARESRPGCDAGALERFLANLLPADEESWVESHVEECPTCRERLEALAAGPEWWRESRSLLGRHGPDDGDEGPVEPTVRGYQDPEEAVQSVLAYLAPTDEPRSLGRLGPYEVLGVVGRGAMGVVLKVLDPALGRNVAVKVLAPELAACGAARQRFAREARAAAAVTHDNVMAIHAVSEARGLPFLVMPYLRAGSLEQRIRTEGPLPVEAVLRVGLQVAAGLAAAHAQGLVHRDIKPANILLEEGVERVRITDFGLARAVDDASMTQSSVIAGTPQYMSPEQAGGEAIDHRSDLFSLGSVIYAMAAGRPPFRAETTFGVLRKIREMPPRALRELNPRVPDWLERLVERLHAKQPAGRPDSAAEVAALLEQGLAHWQQPEVMPLPDELRCGWAHRLRRAWGRHPGYGRGPALVGLLAMVALLTVGLVRWIPAPTGVGLAGDQAPPVLPAAATAWDDGLDAPLSGIRQEIVRVARD